MQGHSSHRTAACHAPTEEHHVRPTPTDNLAIAKRYLAAIEQGATGDVLAAFLAPDILHEEFPNRLTPNGARNGLAEMLEGAMRGQRATIAQRYDVVHALATENEVALEVNWRATLRVPLGSIPAGGEMRARFAVFMEFRDGKIIRQRNYDCFEPF
jgi:ketosteroid isomerase-like protein